MAVDVADLDSRVRQALADVQAEAAQRGIHTTVLSAFRTPEDQRQLYANYIAGQARQPLPYPERGAVPLAAQPGHSLHEKGLAFDLEADNPGDQSALWDMGRAHGLDALGSSDPTHFQLAKTMSDAVSTADSGDEGMRSLGRKYAAYLIDRGYTPEAAAGIVGNAFQENSLRPGGWGGDNGSSIGMFQWHGDRGKAFESWANANNRDIGDYRTHLDYVAQDLKNNYPEVYKEVMAAKNAGDAANAFMVGYEVPAPATAALDRRVAFANALSGGAVPSLQGGATPGGGGSGAGAQIASSDWQSILGAEPPPAVSELSSLFGGAGGGGGASPSVSSAGVDVGDSSTPPIDLTFAPASTSPEELSARYAQHKPDRQLATLHDLFTIKTIGQPVSKYQTNPQARMA